MPRRRSFTNTLYRAARASNNLRAVVGQSPTGPAWCAGRSTQRAWELPASCSRCSGSASNRSRFIQMLWRRAQPEPEEEPEPGGPTIEVTILADDGSFDRDNGQRVDVAGFRVLGPDEDELHHDDHGPVFPNLFLFRIAGMQHHPVGARSKLAESMNQVLLIHEPDNAVDPNAVRIETMKRDQIGYVHATLAPTLLGSMVHEP
jgi:hypothetical protein